MKIGGSYFRQGVMIIAHFFNLNLRFLSKVLELEYTICEIIYLHQVKRVTIDNGQS